MDMAHIAPFDMQPDAHRFSNSVQLGESSSLEAHSSRTHSSNTRVPETPADDALPVPQLNPEVATIRRINLEEHPNAWAKLRYRIREPAAEFLGTMVLVIFGTGVDCQVVLSTSPQVASSPKGSYLSISFGWAIGAALGVWVSGGISGGHLNPVVTLAQVVYRRFPLRKFPIYFLAQLLGAFFGALITYANYWHAIDLFEGGGRTVPGTAALFATYPLDYMTAVSSFFSEFLGTAILLIVVFAITDTRNIPPPAGLVPVAIFLTIAGIGIALGMETSYAINPARDLGPRMMTAIFYGREVFNFGHQYWLWAPIIATFAGGLVGAGVYDLFVFTGDESRINSAHWRGVRMHDRSKKDDPRDPKSALEGSGVV